MDSERSSGEKTNNTAQTPMRRSKKDRRGSDTNNKVDPEDQTNTIPDVVQEVPEGLESTAKKNDRKILVTNN